MNQKIFHDFLSILKFKESYQLKSSGLNYTELHVLEKIFENEFCKTLTLSKELNISPSTLIGLLDKLEKSSLIKRIRQENDKRVVLVSTTESGKDKILNHIKEDELFLKNLVSHLSSDESYAFFNLLEKVNRSIENPQQLFKE